jgi:hypothetical protein
MLYTCQTLLQCCMFSYNFAARQELAECSAERAVMHRCVHSMERTICAAIKMLAEHQRLAKLSSAERAVMHLSVHSIE